MVGQTIAARFCETKNLAARHILQDKAALVGAQGVVSEELEARLADEEAKELESMFVGRNRGRVYAFPDAAESEDHTIREEGGTAASHKSSSEDAEWLRGMAVVCPREDIVAAR